MDRYFTPAALAAKVIESLSLPEPSAAADFAAGEGSLLAAVRDRWPYSRLFATDSDELSLRCLRKRLSDVSTRTCDFLDKSNRKSQFFRKLEGTLPLVVLNPPFTCRGGAKFGVEIGASEFKCSRALAFVVEGTRYLNAEGRLVAILPSSSLTSLRDEATINALLDRFYLSNIIGANEQSVTGWSVEVRCVEFRRRLRSIKNDVSIIHEFHQKSIVSGAKIFRGRVSMCDVVLSSSIGADLVHTTDLVGNTVQLSGVKVLASAVLRGPVVLIPRVGRPKREKIALHLFERPAVLSDCVIGIQAESFEKTRAIFNILLYKWPLIERLYMGSCARYVTLRGLRAALLQIGISSEIGSSVDAALVLQGAMAE